MLKIWRDHPKKRARKVADGDLMAVLFGVMWAVYACHELAWEEKEEGGKVKKEQYVHREVWGILIFPFVLALGVLVAFI